MRHAMMANRRSGLPAGPARGLVSESFELRGIRPVVLSDHYGPPSPQHSCILSQSTSRPRASEVLCLSATGTDRSPAGGP
eukprot:632460-Hanusia_phi.AAC.8